MRTEQELIDEAFAVQNASNLVAVARSFSLALIALRELPENRGSAWINRHIVSQLYSSKIRSMAGDYYEEN